MGKKISVFLFLLALSGHFVYADEFDGGIPIDEPIKDKLDKGINIQYIKRNAKASAKSGKNIKGCDGSGNQTFGPGANLKNATIVNLSDNKGATSVCTK